MIVKCPECRAPITVLVLKREAEARPMLRPAEGQHDPTRCLRLDCAECGAMTSA